MEVHACNPNTRRQRLEYVCKFKANMVYIGSSIQAGLSRKTLYQTNKQKNINVYQDTTCIKSLLTLPIICHLLSVRDPEKSVRSHSA